MRIVRAVDLGPAVWASGLFGPDFDKAEFLLQLRITHDLVAQGSAASRDDLDHRLHRQFSESSRRSVSSIINQRAKHDVNIDVSFFRMSKCGRQGADDLETELLPKMNGRLIR